MTDIPKIVPWFEFFFKTKTGEGIVLERGKQYLVVFSDRLNDRVVDDLREYLEATEKEYKCKFFVLHGYGEVPSFYDVSELDIIAKMDPKELDERVPVFPMSRKFRKVLNGDDNEGIG